jgi:hypothetical protein
VVVSHVGLNNLIHPGGILSQAKSCQKNEKRKALMHGAHVYRFSESGASLSRESRESRLRTSDRHIRGNQPQPNVAEKSGAITD